MSTTSQCRQAECFGVRCRTGCRSDGLMHADSCVREEGRTVYPGAVSTRSVPSFVLRGAACSVEEVCKETENRSSNKCSASRNGPTNRPKHLKTRGPLGISERDASQQAIFWRTAHRCWGVRGRLNQRCWTVGFRDGCAGWTRMLQRQ